MANLEDTPAWQDILPLLNTMSIPALARKMNVPPGELAVALKRTGTPRVASRAMGSPPPEPADYAAILTRPPESVFGPRSVTPSIPGQRPSKLDRHRELIGAMPDAAVAAKVGMSIQAVRNYRQKHGISAVGRRRTQEELEITSVIPLSVGHSLAASGGSWAWRVVFTDNTARIVLADDAASAATRAQVAGLGAVTLIERLNEAL